MNAIYARQSIDKKDSISIESQIDFCKKEAHGQSVTVYSDKGFSGSNIHRPDFERMLNDVKSGKINKVIVYRLDRISRSLLDFANIIELFKANNVEFVSATEKFDTSTPMGNAMLSITMVFAQLERETIQKRIEDNYYARGKKGFFLGGKTPYGFQKEPIQIDGVKTSNLVPNPTEAPHLLKMYQMYASMDISLGKLSDYLNEHNIPAPFGGRLDSLKISRILHNPVYVKANADIYLYFKEKGCIITNDLSDFVGTNGCYLYGKRDRSAGKYTDISNHTLSLSIHKGLIEPDEWLQCQYKLDNNKQIKNTGRGKYTWLSGLTKCGYCGYAMTVSTFKDYKYFICRGRTNYHVCDSHTKTIYVEDIESYVEQEIQKKGKKLTAVKEIDTQQPTEEYNSIKIQLIEIERQLENLIDNLANANAVVSKYINDKITALDRQKTALMEDLKLHTMKSKNDDLSSIVQKINDWDNQSFESKKHIAHALIKRINIKKDEIQIDWNY